MPNGRSNILERQQGADAGGYSGLEDEVDNHWAELFKAALLSTILGVGAELGAGADNATTRTFSRRFALGLRIRSTKPASKSLAAISISSRR